MTLQWTIPGLQLAVRAAAAAAMSLAIAGALQLEYPLYTLLGAIIATDITPLQSRQLGTWRLFATGVGTLCGAILSPILPQAAWAIGFSILLTMFACQLIQGNRAAKMAGYICAIVMLHYAAEAWSHAFQRFVETALGVAIAWAISFVPKLLGDGKDQQQKRFAQSPPQVWYSRFFNALRQCTYGA